MTKKELQSYISQFQAIKRVESQRKTSAATRLFQLSSMYQIFKNALASQADKPLKACRARWVVLKKAYSL